MAFFRNVDWDWKKYEQILLDKNKIWWTIEWREHINIKIVFKNNDDDDDYGNLEQWKLTLAPRINLIFPLKFEVND